MIELILVRHGETDSNKKGTYLGWTDVELNKTGIRQAQCAAEKLKDIKADRIYSSPLKRAMKTAETIDGILKVGVKCVECLKEKNFGVWDDLTFAEILEKYADEYKEYKNDPVNFCADGGESSLQAYTRVTKFIDELIGNADRGTFIVVTHLGCVRYIISHLLGMGIEGSWRFRVDNCGIVRVRINDEKYAYLTALNV